jgi:hypothetical protein
LVTTLQELTALQVGFVSLSEALDLTTPSGRALAGMLAVFTEFERDILRDRVKAGIAQARKEGRPHGRPPTITKHSSEVRRLFQEGVSKREIAKMLGISRTSVRRFLDEQPPPIPWRAIFSVPRSDPFPRQTVPELPDLLPADRRRDRRYPGLTRGAGHPCHLGRGSVGIMPPPRRAVSTEKRGQNGMARGFPQPVPVTSVVSSIPN